MRELADGRAYTGRQALDLGLIDAIGGERGSAGLAGRPKRAFPRPCRSRICTSRASPGACSWARWHRFWGDLMKSLVSQGLSLDGAWSVWQPALGSRLSGRNAGAVNMTKSELIADLSAANPHLRGQDVELIVATVFNEITAALARGERVELRGFGAFTVKRREARTGRNPRTGEAVPVDEKAVPFFKAGKELRERVNRGKRDARKAPEGRQGAGVVA